MTRRQWTGIIVLTLSLALAVFARLMITRDGMSGSVSFEWPESAISSLRCGAVVSGLLGGGCLGLSGLFLQALLRNPLASPFVLGLSAGAGLGATLALWTATVASSSTISWFVVVLLGALGGANAVLPGTVGSIVVLALVYALGRRNGRLDPLTLILAGTVIATMCGALTLLVQSMMPPSSKGESWVWFMGQVPELPSRMNVFIALGLIVGLTVIGLRSGRALDVASTSDTEAESLGVSLRQLRIWLFVGAGALAAASVALCGPLAFVGFVAPHLCRLLLGARHRALVPASVIAGAALLIWADAIRQSIDVGSGRLPIGVLTALVGGPVFLMVLRSRRLAPGGWSC